MSRTRRWIVGGIIGILVIGVFGKVVGAEEPESTSAPATTGASAAPTSSPPTTTSARTPAVTTEPMITEAMTTPAASQPGYVVVSVVDGDTVRVRPGGAGSEQRVRLIGIDAPETGTCEAAAATSALEALVLNRTVTLTMGGDGEDVDPYGRLLRYLDTTADTSGDAGLAMITDGHAIARYDSRDGYGRHDREDAYVAADAASPAYTCPPPAPTTGSSAGSTTSENPVPLVAPIPAANEETTGVREPTTSPAPAAAYYPNCTAARVAGAAPLYAGQPGYSSKLDRDGDGVACE